MKSFLQRWGGALLAMTVAASIFYTVHTTSDTNAKVSHLNDSLYCVNAIITELGHLKPHQEFELPNICYRAAKIPR